MRKAFGFKHAIRGFAVAVGQELNMRIHILAIVVVTVAGILGRIERWAWVAVLLSFALVVMAEMFNTVVERVCDKITSEQSPIIKDIKDIAAGAVFFVAIISAGVAVVVFVRPEVWENWIRFFKVAK